MKPMSNLCNPIPKYATLTQPTPRGTGVTKIMPNKPVRVLSGGRPKSEGKKDSGAKKR